MHPLLLVVDKLIPTSCLNTDKTDNPDEIFAKEAPEGIDVNWVNVGGKAFETELAHSALHGRVIVCGWISAYNGKSDGITNLFQIVAKRLQ
jgi:NADPH-dependent curcumin reductase CurA